MTRKKIIAFVLLIFLFSGIQLSGGRSAPRAFGDPPSFEEYIRNFSVDELWQFFLEYSDSRIKAEILIAMGKRGKGNIDVTTKIFNYLIEMNSLFRRGARADYLVVSASIAAMIELNDSVFYSVLFDIMRSGYPEVITSEARGALDLINGDLARFLYQVIDESSPLEKNIALKAALSSEWLSASQRGQLALLALEKALSQNYDNADLTEMRYAAVLELSSLGWTNAASRAISHYYRVSEDYRGNAALKNRFIEAIGCLGSVGDSRAAVALGLRLALINERTRTTGDFDADITMAIIQALGNIGASNVFDHLRNVENLSYPDYIKIAATEAIDRLKW